MTGEVILTKEEYGKLISSEFDNGYAKGYREVLEQEDINSVLEDVKAEIKEMVTFENVDDLVNVTRIIDKHRRGEK